MWDPRSYLSDAATQHVLTVDADATATTIVGYYDYISDHLECNQRTDTISAELKAQQLRGTAEGMIRLEGVAMRVPYQVLLAYDSGSSGLLQLPDDASTTAAALLQSTLAQTVIDAFEAFEDTFGHQSTSTVRKLTGASEVEISDASLWEVLQAAVMLQRHEACQGYFSIRGKRLMHSYQSALDACPASVTQFHQFTPPSDPSSPFHALYREGVADLQSDVWLSPSPSQSPSEPLGVLHKRSGMPLDVDALAKGHIVDQLCTLLHRPSSGGSPAFLGRESLKTRVAEALHRFESESSMRVCGGLCDWGGDIRVFGRPSELRPTSDCSMVEANSPCWTVGIVHPPRLDALYTAWHSSRSSAVHADPATTAISARKEKYLHAVHLAGDEPSTAAIATSGDYRQARRFAMTHILNPLQSAPCRAHSYTVSSVSVMAASAMVADGISTALFASQRLQILLSLVPGLRKLGLLSRFYVFVRNKSQFVHDEDDEVPGQCDEERWNAADPQRWLQRAIGSVSVDGHDKGRPHPQPRSRASHHSRDGDSPATVAWLPSANRANVEAVHRVQNADAFHHVTKDFMVGLHGDDDVDAGYGFHVRSDASALSRVLLQACRCWVPWHEAVLVCGSEAQSSIGASSKSVPLLVSRLDSVVLCCVQPPVLRSRSDPFWLSCNVMRSSGAHNAIVRALEEHGPVVMHFPLREEATSRLPSTSAEEHLLFSVEFSTWLKKHQNDTVFLEMDGGHRAATIRSLASFSQTAACFVKSCERAGDHIVVVMECFPAAAFDDESEQAAFDARQMRSSWDNMREYELESASRRSNFTPSMKPRRDFPFCPILLAAKHVHVGSVAIPGFGIRVCSRQPLMVSAHFVKSSASDVFTSMAAGGGGDSLMASPDMAFVVPSSSSSWFDAALVGCPRNTDAFSFSPFPASRLRGLWTRSPGSQGGENGLAFEDARSVHEDALMVIRCRLVSVVPPSDETSSDGDARWLLCAVVVGLHLRSGSQDLTNEGALRQIQDSFERGTAAIEGCLAYNTSDGSTAHFR